MVIDLFNGAYNNLSSHQHILQWWDDLADKIPCKYVIVGSYALHQYVPHRTYSDIDIFSKGYDRQRIYSTFDVTDVIYSFYGTKNVYSKKSYRMFVPFNGIQMDIRFFDVTSLLWIIDEATLSNNHGTKTSIATKEALLYLYLMSTDDKHRNDISLLLNETDVDVQYVIDKLELYTRYDIISKLDTILVEENLKMPKEEDNHGAIYF